MNENVADMILLWHSVHVDLGKCIESARVVLDQSDRGTLLPDRVREMRGELLAVQEKIPQLADLLESWTGETVWPMKAEEPSLVADPIMGEEEAAEEAAELTHADAEPVPTAEGDYDTEGSTPTEDVPVDTEAAAELEAGNPEPEAEADATGTP